MKYYVIGDEDTALGFGLVGVHGRAVESRDEAQSAFDTALSDTDVGVILITERVAELIRPSVDRYIFTRDFPLIVEITDRRGPLAGKPGLREMVNHVIGIKL
jgi:V/A-type H+-transporting ATPase subunit F